MKGKIIPLSFRPRQDSETGREVIRLTTALNERDADTASIRARGRDC